MMCVAGGLIFDYDTAYITNKNIGLLDIRNNEL